MRAAKGRPSLELMPRLPRSLLPDGIYHVTSRGVEHRLIFLDDDDRRLFLTLLLEVVEAFGWQVHALCLMGTHYHLVVECTRRDLSDGMQELNGRYAQSFNVKYGRWGHLFGDRFASRLIRDEQHLAAACRYVVGNPPAAGLCERPEDWPWSHTRYAEDRGAVNVHPRTDDRTGAAGDRRYENGPGDPARNRASAGDERPADRRGARQAPAPALWRPRRPTSRPSGPRQIADTSLRALNDRNSSATRTPNRPERSPGGRPDDRGSRSRSQVAARPFQDRAALRG